jgi:hypothetical protein
VATEQPVQRNVHEEHRLFPEMITTPSFELSISGGRVEIYRLSSQIVTMLLCRIII